LPLKRKAKNCQCLASNGWMHRLRHTKNAFFEMQNQSGAQIFVRCCGRCRRVRIQGRDQGQISQRFIAPLQCGSDATIVMKPEKSINRFPGGAARTLLLLQDVFIMLDFLVEIVRRCRAGNWTCKSVKEDESYQLDQVS
jgi:hypothetical protein